MASVQCEVADREEPCACEEHPPPSLDILKEVHRVYEERMRLVERVGGDKKMQMQVEVLRSWVSDLVGQNTLLVRAVEELEAEATKRLHDERIRHLEREKVCDRKKMYDSWNELKILNDSLQKENTAKDREIRRLNKDVQQYEQTIITLKNKIALSESNTPEVSKKDAEVMVEMCGAGNDCGDWEPVKDYSALLCEETIGYQTRIHKLEADLKSTCDSVRTLRKMNTAITEELKAMRRVCAVLDEQCHAASARAQFKDDIIREMRRQLKQAKNKVSRRHMTTSTSQLMTDNSTNVTPDVSVIRRSSSDPIVILDNSDLHPQNNDMASSTQHSTPHVRVQSPETTSFKNNKLFNQSDKRKLEIVVKNEGEHSRENAPEFQESPCTSSVAGSVSGSAGQCNAEARAQYYHNKLLATLQILHNSEETVRVQAESLRLAEARIAALTDRAAEMRLELTRKSHELRVLQSAVDVDKIDKTDVSITAEIQERKNHNVVSTLQSNLSVIEELYRECFYEAAKQEELIDMLRNSCLDVRLRQKTEQIERLQSVVHTQKWSLVRCQDIAMEVDNLKMEISNFLNNSNNDSGMWEREDSLATEVSEELHDITAQLLQLRDMLAGDCTCGLQEENSRLKQLLKTKEIQIEELRQRLADMETQVMDRQTLDDVNRQQIEVKEKELDKLRQQLLSLEEGTRDQSTTCDTLTRQLQQTQVLLRDKTAELAEVQQQCKIQKQTIHRLQEELDRSNQTINENAQIRAEVSQLKSQVSRWRSQLADSEKRLCLLESELQRARAHCRDVDDCYREKCRCAGELQAQLEEAQSRGAALCEEARRVVGGVRHWVRRMRHTNREQENKIKEQETIINSLQRLSGKHSQHSLHDADSCCPNKRREQSRLDDAEPSCSRVEQRCEERFSESEIASCSSAPIPPRRLMKKLQFCGDKRCSAGNSHRAGGVQPSPPTPATSPTPPTPDTPRCCNHAHTRHVRVVGTPFQREMSPTEELYERVEQLYEALNSGHRRWSRARTASHSR